MYSISECQHLQNQICTKNKEYISDHRCERMSMACVTLLTSHKDNTNGSWKCIFITFLWIRLFTLYTLSFIHKVAHRDVALRTIYMQPYMSLHFICDCQINTFYKGWTDIIITIICYIILLITKNKCKLCFYEMQWVWICSAYGCHMLCIWYFGVYSYQ